MKKVQSSKFKVQSFFHSCRGGGYTLVEMLVVISVFSILAILATQSIATSLKTTKKSESVDKVRENVEFALNIIERQLHNARSLDCSLSGNVVNYFDEYEENASFTCETAGGDSFIASNSATRTDRLTNTDVRIVNCGTVFSSCNETTIPHSINVTITAESSGIVGAEAGQVTSSTKILLRNY